MKAQLEKLKQLEWRDTMAPLMLLGIVAALVVTDPKTPEDFIGDAANPNGGVIREMTTFRAQATYVPLYCAATDHKVALVMVEMPNKDIDIVTVCCATAEQCREENRLRVPKKVKE